MSYTADVYLSSVGFAFSRRFANSSVKSVLVCLSSHLFHECSSCSINSVTVRKKDGTTLFESIVRSFPWHLWLMTVRHLSRQSGDAWWMGQCSGIHDKIVKHLYRYSALFLARSTQWICMFISQTMCKVNHITKMRKVDHITKKVVVFCGICFFFVFFFCIHRDICIYSTKIAVNF